MNNERSTYEAPYNINRSPQALLFTHSQYPTDPGHTWRRLQHPFNHLESLSIRNMSTILIFVLIITVSGTLATPETSEKKFTGSFK